VAALQANFVAEVIGWMSAGTLRSAAECNYDTCTTCCSPDGRCIDEQEVSDGQCAVDEPGGRCLPCDPGWTCGGEHVCVPPPQVSLPEWTLATYDIVFDRADLTYDDSWVSDDIPNGATWVWPPDALGGVGGDYQPGNFIEVGKYVARSAPYTIGNYWMGLGLWDDNGVNAAWNCQVRFSPEQLQQAVNRGGTYTFQQACQNDSMLVTFTIRAHLPSSGLSGSGAAGETTRTALTAADVESQIVGRTAGRWIFVAGEPLHTEVADVQYTPDTATAMVDIETSSSDGFQHAAGRVRARFRWGDGAWVLQSVESVSFDCVDCAP
jgi:hypothetical protein